MFPYSNKPDNTISHSSFSNKNNNFNLLRFILASLVILSHSIELADGSRHREIFTMIFGTISFGELAVYGFFTLSGFLIAGSWLSKPSPADFLKKRVLRIFPAFIVCTLLCAFIFGRLGSDSNYYHNLNIFKLIAGIFYLHLPAVPPVFKGSFYPLVNASMWSIYYEFRCYLMVMLFGLFGLLGRKYLWLIFSIVVLVLSSIPGLFTTNPSNLVYVIFGEPDMLMPLLPFFCAGVCYYLFSNYVKLKTKYAVVAFFLLLPCLFNTYTVMPGLVLFGSYLLFYFAFAQISLIQFFRKLPDISYGVYLYAFPIQKLILWYFPDLSPGLLFPLSFIGACLFGWVSWTLIEKPALKFKSINFFPPMSLYLNRIKVFNKQFKARFH